MDKNDKIFTVEHQFQEYARRVKISKDSVSPIQWIETRRAFFGAYAQLLAVFRDDLSELSEDDGVEVLEKMWQEVSNFWLGENNRQN